MINPKNWFQIQKMYGYVRKQAENEKFVKYLEIGGTFTLVALFLFFAILPTMTTVSALIGDIKAKEAFIKKVDTKIMNVNKAQTVFSNAQEKYSLIEDSFPVLAQYYNGASNLAIIFRDSSLDINQIGINLPKEDEEKQNNKLFKSYQVSVSGQGQYSSIMKMIKETLNNRRPLDIVNIRLDKIKSDSNSNVPVSNNIKISISSNLYFLPQNNEKK